MNLSLVQNGRQEAWPIPAGTHALTSTVTGAQLSIRHDDDGVHLTVTGTFNADVSLRMTVPVGRANRVLWPTYQGVIERRQPETDVGFEFRGPGWQGSGRDDRRVGIPAVFVSHADGYTVVGTDPGFSARLSVTGGAAPAVSVEWTYRHEAGHHDGLERRIVTATAGTLREALTRWFELALPDVPAGPAWLHDIAWTNYDFMSNNGRGWYGDIDAFCALVGPDRHHWAAFTLHAWYDTVGRYCYDPATKQLDQQWTVFPYINDPRLLVRQGVPDPSGTHLPAYTFRNLDRYHPLTMNWDDIRARISYAKQRGLRVPFYLCTGMMGQGDREEHIATGTGLDAPTHLWIGPDAVGDTYLMNPLHPDVRERFLGLTRAVLEQVGDLIDALVIDEAYYIGYGQLGPAARPGYADLAQATLLREMAAIGHTFRPDIAMLSADHLGTQSLEHIAYPYSLYLDGIYHDAWCHAQTWEACRIPAWRNTIWSCNWAPASAIANTKWAVLRYDAPIATGNGCFGDDIGLAEMSADQQELLASLWRTATSRHRERTLTIVDVDETGRGPSLA